MTMKPEGEVLIMKDDETQSPITQEYKEKYGLVIMPDMGSAYDLIGRLYSKQIKTHKKIVQRYIVTPYD